MTRLDVCCSKPRAPGAEALDPKRHPAGDMPHDGVALPGKGQICAQPRTRTRANRSRSCSPCAELSGASSLASAASLAAVA
jgi:hypothetical protein